MSHSPAPGRVRFGICADPHKDIMHDADQRLQVFVDRMNRARVDFVIHLGDFRRPYEYNRSFMDVWEGFDGPRHHVLGNHDPDGDFTREQVMAYWGMPSRYYSFDLGGYHFVVLDGNDRKEDPPPGYPRYIAPDQLAWLREDLNASDAPAFVFSHQSLEDPEGVENGGYVRAALEEANEAAGRRKVVACFSGHHHIDYCTRINGIHYIQINSMSNYWLGGDYLCIRYSEEIDRQYPWVKYTAPYRDSLYGLVALESADTITIEGVDSEFVGPSPWELGYPHEAFRDRIVPRIVPRRIEM